MRAEIFRVGDYLPDGRRPQVGVVFGTERRKDAGLELSPDVGD